MLAILSDASVTGNLRIRRPPRGVFFPAPSLASYTSQRTAGHKKTKRLRPRPGRRCNSTTLVAPPSIMPDASSEQPALGSAEVWHCSLSQEIIAGKFYRVPDKSAFVGLHPAGAEAYPPVRGKDVSAPLATLGTHVNSFPAR